MPSPLRSSSESLRAFRSSAALATNLKDQEESTLKYHVQNFQPENQEENPQEVTTDTSKSTCDKKSSIQEDDGPGDMPPEGHVQSVITLSDAVVINPSPTRRQPHETFARMPSAPVHGSNTLLSTSERSPRSSECSSSSSAMGNRHTRRRATEPEQVLRDISPRLRASSSAFISTSPSATFMVPQDFEYVLRPLEPVSTSSTTPHVSPSKAPVLSTINDLNLSIRNNLLETLYQIEHPKDEGEDDSDEVEQEDTIQLPQNFGVPVDEVIHTPPRLHQLHPRASGSQLRRSSHVSSSRIRSSASSSNKSRKSSNSSNLLAKNMTLADTVRLSYAHALGSFPSKCLKEGRLCVEGRSKEYMVTLTEAGLSWWVPNVFFTSFKKRSLQLDAIVGATNDFTGVFTVHFYIKASSSISKRLLRGESGSAFALSSPKKLSKRKGSSRPSRREHGCISFRSVHSEDAIAWVEAIQLAVKWSARVPLKANRNLLVVLNEPIDSYKTDNLWRQHKNSLDIGRFSYEVIQTQTVEEMRTLGRNFGGGTPAGTVSPSSSNTSSKRSKYECILFIGPERMVNCFYEGVLQQRQDDWKYLLATLPIAFLPMTKRLAGESHSLLLPSHETVLYCILKRKYKKVNAITFQTDAHPHVCVAFADIAFGIGSTGSSNTASNTEATSPKSPSRSSFSGFLTPASPTNRPSAERRGSSSQVIIQNLKQAYFFSSDMVAEFKYVPASTSMKSTTSNPNAPVGRKERYHLDEQEEQEEQEDEDEQEEEELHHIEFCSVYNRQVPQELKRWNGASVSVLDPGAEQVFDKEWKETENGHFFSMQVTQNQQEKHHPPLLNLVVHRKQQSVSQLFSGKRRLPSWLRDEAKAVMIQHTKPTPLRVDGHILPLKIQEMRAQLTKNLILLTFE